MLPLLKCEEVEYPDTFHSNSTFRIIKLRHHFVVLKEDETGDAGDAEFVGDASVKEGVDGADFEEREGASEGVDVRRDFHGKPAVGREDEKQNAVALLGLPVL